MSEKGRRETARQFDVEKTLNLVLPDISGKLFGASVRVQPAGVRQCDLSLLAK